MFPACWFRQRIFSILLDYYFYLFFFFCLDVVRVHMNEARNETWTHLRRFFTRLDLFAALYIYIYIYIGIMVTVFTNGQGDHGLIPRGFITKTQKMVLDASLIGNQHLWYESRASRAIQGKEQYPTYTSV